MSTQHTPTPHLGNGIASAGHWFIADEGGARGIKRELFDEFGEHAGYELLCGDSDQIVNSHDALVEALNRAFIRFGMFGGNHALSAGDPSAVTIKHSDIRDAWLDARAALKAATQE